MDMSEELELLINGEKEEVDNEVDDDAENIPGIRKLEDVEDDNGDAGDGGDDIIF